MKGCAEMNWIGIICILTGVFYLMYSVLRRDKIAYQSRKYFRTSAMTIIKLSEFLRLQLIFSTFNSIYLVIYGILIIVFNLNDVFIIVGVVPFHLINFLFIIESKKKGYVNYKVGETYK